MPVTAPTNTLQTIQNKVRLLTRSPSEAQLTTTQLNQYINTAVVYEFPEQLRMFNLRTVFTFYTNTGQDVYPTDIASFGGAANADTNPLYNFQNIYLTVHDPVYIAGFPALYSQSRQKFFGIYPIVNNISSIGRYGDGVTQTFSGVINSQQSYIPNGFNQQIALLQNEVLFSSVDINGNGLAMADFPLLDSVTGMPTTYGQLYRPDNFPSAPILISAPYIFGTGPGEINPLNFINYQTGNFTVTFDNPPKVGASIDSQTRPQNLARPTALLFYDNKFLVRPVPNQPYRVDFECYIRPTFLMEGQSPALEEWWELISYFASRKILQDRLDVDSVAIIEPELNRQMRLCLRRTIVQLTNERTATIYSEQSDGNGQGWGNWGSGI